MGVAESPPPGSPAGVAGRVWVDTGRLGDGAGAVGEGAGDADTAPDGTVADADGWDGPGWPWSVPQTAGEPRNRPRTRTSSPCPESLSWPRSATCGAPSPQPRSPRHPTATRPQRPAGATPRCTTAAPSAPAPATGPVRRVLGGPQVRHPGDDRRTLPITAPAACPWCRRGSRPMNRPTGRRWPRRRPRRPGSQ